MEITTPALLFPAISLLLLAYTNRFMVLTGVIRQLSHMEDEAPDIIERQITSLGLRLKIVKTMQLLGVSSFMFCAIAMLLRFLHVDFASSVIFGFSLFLLVGSLLFSLWEVHLSTEAINIEIEQFQKRISKG